MKLSVVKSKAGLAKKHAASVPETGTGKKRANSECSTWNNELPPIKNFEIYFDADADTWYCFNTLTGDYTACAGRRDCETAVAIANGDALLQQILEARGQQRLFK